LRCHCNNTVNLRGEKGAVCSSCGCKFVESPGDGPPTLARKGGACWVRGVE
jgi:hypothetical protein